MKRDVDQAEIERSMIRALQAMYSKEHRALVNYARWGKHGRCGPSGYPTRCKSIPDHDSKEWEAAGYGGEVEVPPERRAQDDRRAERDETEPYDKAAAILLSDRLHGVGGLPEYLLSVIKVAYCESVNIPEDKFHLLCTPSTTPEEFRQRLEDSLIFVGRFV